MSNKMALDALKKIAAMDAEGVRADDLGRAAVVARAAIAALEAEPQGWMPIETAPKDKEILLATEFDRPGDWRIKVGYFHEEVGQWRVWGGSWTPSRWMPLPATPPKD